jgi:hemerythrin
MAFLWNDDYLLGIQIIDEQHKWFVNTLSELEEALTKSVDIQSKIETIFNKLEAYAQFHFATEEKYFDEFGYEGSTEHKAEHKKFKEKLADIRKQYLTNQLDTAFDLADYLEDWLLNHLATMDKKYVECFHSHGLK